MSVRGCNPGNCLELQEARKENQGIKSSLNLTATLHKRQNFFPYPLFTKDSWKHFDWVNDHEIRERVDKFSSADCGGMPKEVWEEYWADFFVCLHGISQVAPACIGETKNRKSLEAGHLPNQVFWIKMSSLQHRVAV